MLRADFSRPLDFLEDESFDIVLSAQALDYVEDWKAVFAEFHKVLMTGGVLVFSIEHPAAKFYEHGGENYFETELEHVEWRGYGERMDMPSYRRPMGAVMNSLLDSGFSVERLLEPKPTEQFEQADPAKHEELSKKPGFLYIRAAKL